MLRVAVIGAGFFARFHYEAWARLPDVELIGACDLDPARAQAAASEFGGAAWADPAAMVAALKPDLIDIASPPATHLAMVRLAAEAGIACICQKPLAPTLAESAEIVAVAKQAGIPLIVHENFRFQPWYREIKRWIDGGLSCLPLGGAMRDAPYDWENRGFGGDCVAALQAHAADHLLHGGALENAGEDYLRNIEIEEAVYRSAAEGRRIELDQGLESLRPNATTLP